MAEICGTTPEAGCSARRCRRSRRRDHALLVRAPPESLRRSPARHPHARSMILQIFRRTPRTTTPKTVKSWEKRTLAGPRSGRDGYDPIAVNALVPRPNHGTVDDKRSVSTKLRDRAAVEALACGELSLLVCAATRAAPPPSSDSARRCRAAQLFSHRHARKLPRAARVLDRFRRPMRAAGPPSARIRASSVRRRTPHIHAQRSQQGLEPLTRAPPMSEIGSSFADGGSRF